jgi:hypothetical protein
MSTSLQEPVQWWFGTTRYAPFFRASIDELRPVRSRSVSR